MITRHQFLTMLHDLLKPKIYLEVGVQYGLSLDLAVHSEVAIGVDPNPLVQAQGNQMIFQTTSNDFFANYLRDEQIDLAFIDGSHLFEDALRDFINITNISGPDTVIVFDDMLPYNEPIAAREMPPGGDWTGDVWKIMPILKKLHLSGTKMAAVDTWPTGTFVVWNLPIVDRIGFRTTGLELARLELDYEDIVAKYLGTEAVPDYVLNRTHAFEPEDVIDRIREDLNL